MFYRKQFMNSCKPSKLNNRVIIKCYAYFFFLHCNSESIFKDVLYGLKCRKICFPKMKEVKISIQNYARLVCLVSNFFLECQQLFTRHFVRQIFDMESCLETWAGGVPVDIQINKYFNNTSLTS